MLKPNKFIFYGVPYLSHNWKSHSVSKYMLPTGLEPTTFRV